MAVLVTLPVDLPTNALELVVTTTTTTTTTIGVTTTTTIMGTIEVAEIAIVTITATVTATMTGVEIAMIAGAETGTIDAIAVTTRMTVDTMTVMLANPVMMTGVGATEAVRSLSGGSLVLPFPS
jgi:hypothetical protein